MSQIQLERLISQDWRQHKLAGVLLLACIASALAVVYLAHLNRQLTIAQDTYYQQRDQLDTQWRNLLLEQRSLAEHSRVEDIARRRLNMQRPSGERDIMVRPQ
ncbi:MULTISPECIES: cell division protein FtsL [unclassified Arsukibacterium]|uniref:cell division protein FtsL n=1 Tax=unclassified Arsukibacterium TaxID=2635278 RepID=UPI000C6298A0|nr:MULTISPECIES: cell division protein FtsL [unclassified Arsukibacterium]MBM34924.1 cell division protein FtsL [Rheinheimera sp.]HAW94562.1 cell division protein FtsL [Candidatus Azambacteria bacterium]|tara:strand:- start:52563 stop:52871 length:309 start_codon:yes stop_codon:yes gene_type:complete